MYMACCATYSSQGRGGSLPRQISRQSSDGEKESFFSDELEFLQNVYLDELTFDPELCDSDGHTLQFHVTPSTGDDKERQYVYLVLIVTVGQNYPLVPPKCSFGQSRGLSDSHLRSMQEGLSQKSVELTGTQMIYELVEFAKDCLTDNNTPSEECAICLCSFQDSDDFKKTDCYHYFHLSCLAGYMDFYERQVRETEEEDSRVDFMLRKKAKQLECPVCRVPMTITQMPFDLSNEWSSPSQSNKVFTPSPELRAWQRDMEQLLWQQRQKGGVIDLSRSDVIDETWVSSVGNTDLSPTKTVCAQDNSLPQSQRETATKSDTKHYQRGKNRRRGDRKSDSNAGRQGDKPDSSAGRQGVKHDSSAGRQGVKPPSTNGTTNKISRPNTRGQKYTNSRRDDTHSPRQQRSRPPRQIVTADQRNDLRQASSDNSEVLATVNSKVAEMVTKTSSAPVVSHPRESATADNSQSHSIGKPQTRSNDSSSHINRKPRGPRGNRGPKYSNDEPNYKSREPYSNPRQRNPKPRDMDSREISKTIHQEQKVHVE